MERECESERDPVGIISVQWAGIAMTNITNGENVQPRTPTPSLHPRQER